MAARRNSKRRRRRRGRFGFLYKCLSLVLILAAIVTGCIVFFRVNNVVVSGQSRYTAEEIIAASGVEQGDNLLLLPTDQIANRIRSELPYIDAFHPRRGLPDTLFISVTECVPAALIQGGEGWWIIDAKGKLLEQVPGPSARPGLAAVTGVTALLPAAGAYLALGEEEAIRQDSLIQLLGALSERDMLGRVADIDLSAVARITFLYDGHVTVELPLVDDFATKLRGLELAMENIQENEKGTLDITRPVGERWPFTLDK